MRQLSYDNIQSIFLNANASKPDDSGDTQEIDKLYLEKNAAFSYFDVSDTDSKNLFLCFYHFFQKVSESEDTHVSKNELAGRAYVATVLFGGNKPGKECKTLQRYLNDHYKNARQPIHDAFATIKIQPKSQYVDLLFWRELINEQSTEKAIKLFARASDIANKFGPASPSLNSYELVLTKNFPTKRNIHPTVMRLYIHTVRNDPTKFGCAYLNKQGDLISVTVEKKSLECYEKEIQEKFDDSQWQSGELLAHNLSTSAQAQIFKVVNETLAETKKDNPILRRPSLSDVEILHGKLTYSRFEENPEFARLCQQYGVRELI